MTRAKTNRHAAHDFDELAEPLDFGWPRVDVRTDSYYDPALADVVSATEAAHRAATVRSKG